MTDSQKIQEIYRMLKRQRRAKIVGNIFKWSFRLILIGMIFYGYERVFVQGDEQLQETIKEFATKQLSSIVGPIVGDIVKNNPGLFPQSGILPNQGDSNSGTTSGVTHMNRPQIRSIEELLKDQELLKAATNVYKQKTGQ